MCLLCLGATWLPTPARAGAGVAITLENMFVPLGKQTEKVFDGTTPISASVSPLPSGAVQSSNPQGQTVVIPAAGTSAVLAGRQTAEWVGLSAFFDLNANWRLLGSAHTTLLEGRPLFKFEGALAVMLPVPATVPLQPYLFLGAVPVISAVPDIPVLGFNLSGGLGVDYVWNNAVYAQIRLNTYFLSIYGEDTNNQLNLHWMPASFSLSAGMGILF